MSELFGTSPEVDPAIPEHDENGLVALVPIDSDDRNLPVSRSASWVAM